MEFDMSKEYASIIKVIGVGGGGGNAVNHMYKQGIKGVDFIICNTDAQALELSPVPKKVQLGPTLTEGMGAGSMPEVGKNSAIENIDQIMDLLHNTRMVFITAGMGGGTGTGASPIIAKAAREMGILTVGIVTTPFSFEGKRRRLLAEEGLEELKKNVDTLLVISNDKLREMFGNLTLSNAFSEADDILTTAAKGIAEIITVPGYINVDFEDVKTVMKNSGAAIMGSCSAGGEDRAKKAVVGALSSPLLNDNEIQGAKFILLNISSGKDEVLMDEVTIITDYIQEEAGLTADIIWGNCNDPSLDDHLMVTIIATGFQTKKEKESVRIKSPEKIIKVLHEEEFEVKGASQPSLAYEPILKVESEPMPQKAPAHHFNIPEIKYAWDRIEKRPHPQESAQPPRQVTIFDNQQPATSQPAPDTKKTEEFHYAVRPNLKVRTIYPDEPAVPSVPAAPAREEVKPEVPVNAFRPKAVQDETQVAPIDESLVDPLRKTRERIMRLKELSMKLRTSKGVEDLENEPAYLRKKARFDQIPHSSAEEMSRYTVSDDDHNLQIRSNNSFLHDNVD